MVANTSSCKEESSQHAARPGALALTMQQNAHRPASIAQASPMLVPTAASSPIGHLPAPLFAQGALSPKPYALSPKPHAELPVPDADHAQASALPPADQALSPQAGRQTSPHWRPQPANDVISQPRVADPASGFQSNMSPPMPLTSSIIASMPDASGESVQVPAQWEPQHPGPAAEDAIQQVHDSVIKADKAMVPEESAPEAAKDVGDNQQLPDQSIAAQSATSPSAPNQQSGEDAAMADTAPSSLSPQTGVLVKAEPQSDTPMEGVHTRSAADIFEQTVQDCKKVVEEARSVLLNKETEGAGGGRTSRIAASERATMWYNELQGLLNRCKMPQLYIGVLGDTGGRYFNCGACLHIADVVIIIMPMPKMMSSSLCADLHLLSCSLTGRCLFRNLSWCGVTSAYIDAICCKSHGLTPVVELIQAELQVLESHQLSTVCLERRTFCLSMACAPAQHVLWRYHTFQAACKPLPTNLCVPNYIEWWLEWLYDMPVFVILAGDMHCAAVKAFCLLATHQR